MAKKKEIVIVDKELTPTVLAIKADKKKTSVFSIIWIIVIFGIFVTGVIYLPDIATYVNNYLNPEPVSVPSKTPSKKPVEEEPTPEIKKYKISTNPTIEEENFSLSNIVILNGKINITITNKTNKLLDMSSLNYFINLYNANDSLVQRITLKDVVLGESEVNTLNYDIREENISDVELVNISVNDYPAYNVTPDESGKTILVCQKDLETINYLLTNNKVYAIQDIYEVTSNDPAYTSLYNTYQLLATTYNTITGVNSSVNIEQDILTFRTIINLNTFVTGSINSKIIYPKDTDAKIMKFELEARGYACK